MGELKGLYHSGRGTLQTEIETLRRDLEALKQENTQLRETTVAQAKGLADVTDRLRQAEQRTGELQAANAKLSAEAEAVLAEHHAEFERLMADLRAGGGAAHLTQTEDLAQAQPREHELLAGLQSQVELLWQQLDEKSKQVEKEHLEVKHLESEIAELEQQLTEKERLFDEYKSSIQSQTSQDSREKNLKVSALEHQLAESPATSPAAGQEKPAELEMLRSENALLQQQLQAKAPAANHDGQIRELQSVIGELRKQLRERDRTLQEMSLQGFAHCSLAADHPDLAAYESELAEYHRQLEQDRKQLTDSIAELQARNQQLNETAQKAEEELAKERSKIEHLRDELHIDLAFEDLASLARKHLAPVLRVKKA
jgi:chromosome segregation ATPase